MTTLTISDNLIKRKNLIIIEKTDFEKLERENNELRLAMRAIAEGEKAFKLNKTRSLKDFLESKSFYGKNR